MTKTSEVLRSARAMVSAANYESVTRALRWAAPESGRDLINAIAALRKVLGTLAIQTWFQVSHRTLAEVWALFDQAIAAAEDAERVR